MQSFKQVAYKNQTFSSPFKGVVSYVKRPYHSLRARSLSLTPLNQPDFTQINSSISSSNSFTQIIDNPTSFNMNSTNDFSTSDFSFPEVDISDKSSSFDLNNIITESQKCSLMDLKNSLFEYVLEKKLELCSYMFNFSRNDQNEQREVKTETLNQFITLFENQQLAIQLNPSHRRAIFRMIEINIFSKDPKFPTVSPLAELPPPSTDPSWPHRSPCYQLLIHFIQLFPDYEYVNIMFIKKVIFHFQVPDANERLQLVIFIKKYIDIHEEKRAIALSQIRTAIYFLNEEIYNPYSLMPLMSVFSHLIYKYYDIMKEEIQNAFFESVIPLMSYKYLTISFPHIKNVFLLIIRTDHEISFLTLKKLQKLWPYQNNTKQVFYTDLLISIVSALDQRIFEQISSNFFSFLRDLLYLQQFKLIDTIVNIFINEGYSSWITANATVAIDKLHEPIALISLLSSDKTLKNKCVSAIRFMSSLNNSEFNRCEMLLQNKLKAIENRQSNNNIKNKPLIKTQSKPIIAIEADEDIIQIVKIGAENNFFFITNHDLKKEKRNKEIWMTIANIASKNNSFISNIEMKNKQDEINYFFGHDQKENLTISRFLPASFNHIEPIKNIICRPRPKFLMPAFQKPKQKRSSMRMSVPKCTFYYNLSKSDTNLHI